MSRRTRKRSSLVIAFIIAIGMSAAISVSLDSWNAGISIGAAMFVVFAATGRRNNKND